jgi:predicted hydrocarbon binding protein
MVELEFRNYYVEKLYMTSNVETGILTNRSGRRMIALTNDFLIGLHRALEKECGDQVEQVLYRCGRKWGRNFGEGLDAAWSEFYQAPLSSFPLAFFQGLLVQEFTHNGWGNLVIDYQHYDKGVIELVLVGAIMSDISRDTIKYPADVLTAGIFSGMFTHFVGLEVHCVQSQCSKQGFPDSRFLLSDATRIDRLKEWHANTKTHQEMLDHLLSLQS